jgi:hypothetical protein
MLQIFKTDAQLMKPLYFETHSRMGREDHDLKKKQLRTHIWEK